jgi:hypothetical protein
LSGKRAGDSLRRVAMYWVVAFVPVAMIVLVPQLVVQDGGLHLSSAAAVGGLLGGQWSDLLTWRPGLPPNLTVELLFAGLTRIMDPNWALKLVVVVALLGFAAAAAALARAVGSPPHYAVLLLPFAMNLLVMLGSSDSSARCHWPCTPWPWCCGPQARGAGC